MTKRTDHIAALKQTRVYQEAREAALARLAVETPDTRYLECMDCCWLERCWLERDDLGMPWDECPECGGRLTSGWIRNGVVVTR